MKVIAVAMQKGGAGKTTSTISLAGCLAELEKKVLVIDLDQQGNASDWLIGAEAARGEDLPSDAGDDLKTALLKGEGIEHLILETGFGIDLVPNGPGFVGFDLDSSPNSGYRLRNALRNLPAEWDFVLIDCPPALGTTTLNALTAAQSVLIPVEMSSMSLTGLFQLKETIDEVREYTNDALVIEGVFACKTNNTTLGREVIEALDQAFPSDERMETRIRTNVKLSEAHAEQKPISFYNRKCPGFEDYMSLAKEVINKQTTVEEARRTINE